MPHARSADIVITPLQHGPGKKTNFGAIVTGADLNHLGEESFQKLRNAVYTNNLVVIKSQKDLPPSKQFDLVCRFDPDCKPSHGFGYGKGTAELEATGKKPFYLIPDSGGVTLVGNGYQGPDHYGLKEVTMSGFSHTDFNCDPLSEEEMANGHAKFVHFHFDGIMYDSHPSRVTTFRCVKQPKGPDVTLHVGDQAGSAMKCQPGSTAFIGCAQIYSLLTEEEKKIADNSYWEPAPHPFGWSGTRMYTSNGLGIAPGGETVPPNKLPRWEACKVYRYPLSWLNPVTGEKGFQIMPQCVRKLYLRSSPEEEVRVVDDLEEIRVWLNDILERVAKPEYILIPSCEEGDMIVWNNWGVIQSAIEYPPSYGMRAMHQCHIASSTAPHGPTPVPA